MRHLERLEFDLHVKMLERCDAILTKMDDETLTEALSPNSIPLLSALLNHVNVLQEASPKLDQPQNETIRFEYYYDDKVQDLPPWTGASDGKPRAVQSGRLRPPLGQNGTGDDQHSQRGPAPEQTLLVAGADPTNGGASLART